MPKYWIDRAARKFEVCTIKFRRPLPYLCHHCKARLICTAFAESPPHGRIRGLYPGIAPSYSLVFSTCTHRVVNAFSTYYAKHTKEELRLRESIDECDRVIGRLRQSITELEATLQKAKA
ncbi:MAG: hypothetical protein ACE5Z5_09135 [Candidatus Bathyarchaeia archaeon]